MMRSIFNDWNRFWFSSRPTRSLVPVRLALCLVAAAWFGSFISHASAWFGTDGLLDASVSQKLLEFDQSPGWQNWSPLWLSDSSALHSAWLFIGIVLSLLGAAGVGGRITLLVLWLWIVAWAHRISWLQTSVEPALVASIAYLIVEPGNSIFDRRARAAADTERQTWRAGLTLRLLQTHWWLLVAAGVLSQLASLIWWRGEGVWWLASAGRSNLLSVDMFRGQPSFANLLSHACIAVQLLALWLVTIPSARLIGIVLGGLVGCVYGLMADQLLYAAWLCAALVAFLPATRFGRESKP